MYSEVSEGASKKRGYVEKGLAKAMAGLTLADEDRVCGCGDIDPISDPIEPQSFGLSLAPTRNNINVTASYKSPPVIA